MTNIKEINIKEIEKELREKWDYTATLKYWNKYNKERLYFTCYTNGGYVSGKGCWELQNGILTGKPLTSDCWGETNELLEKYKGYHILL